MKTLLRLLLAALVSVCASAQTAKNRTALYTEIDTLFASNSAITASQLRTGLKDIVASAMNPTADGTPVTTGGSFVDPSWLTLTKAKVGLGSVDNTSDAAKPISTATQTALDSKAAASHSHANATQSAAGFMSAADKLKLDGLSGSSGGIAWGTITGIIGDQSDLAALFAGKVATTRTVNGHALTSDVTVTKADVGLGSVDNTSDAAKPVSTAQASAIAAAQTAATNASQAKSAKLDSIVALTPQSFGLGLLEMANAAAARTYLGVSTGAGDVVGPNGGTTAGQLVVFADTTGKVLVKVPVSVDSSGNITTTGGLNLGSLSATNFSFTNLLSTVPLNKGGTGATTPAAAVEALTVAPVAITGTDIDWSAGSSFTKTLGNHTTFTFSNATDGKTIAVVITNTASNYTVTWPTSAWSGGTQPTQTTGAKSDLWFFTKVGSTYFGRVVQNFTIPGGGGGGGGGGGSATLLMDSTDAATGQWNFGTSNNFAGQQQVAISTATTITRVQAYFDGIGDVSGRTIYCRIYADAGSSGHDLGALAVQSDGVSGTLITGAKTLLTFDFSTLTSLTPGSYHITFYSANDTLGNFNVYWTGVTDISGSLSLWNPSGANQNTGSFPSYNIQMKVYGTTP